MEITKDITLKVTYPRIQTLRAYEPPWTPSIRHDAGVVNPSCFKGNWRLSCGCSFSKKKKWNSWWWAELKAWLLAMNSFDAVIVPLKIPWYNMFAANQTFAQGRSRGSNFTCSIPSVGPVFIGISRKKVPNRRNVNPKPWSPEAPNPGSKKSSHCIQCFRSFVADPSQRTWSQLPENEDVK